MTGVRINTLNPQLKFYKSSQIIVFHQPHLWSPIFVFFLKSLLKKKIKYQISKICWKTHFNLSFMQDGGYDDGGCETELQCSLCNFQQYPRATLRGICKNDWTDIFYTIVFDEVTNMPYFKGFSGTTIKYDEDNQGGF